MANMRMGRTLDVIRMLVRKQKSRASSTRQGQSENEGQGENGNENGNGNGNEGKNNGEKDVIHGECMSVPREADRCHRRQ